jgi:hypothetical protein
LCERAEIVGPDLEFRSSAVQRKARLTRIPAIMEQDLKAGIRDKRPKSPHLSHASPRGGDQRHPGTTVAEHLIVQAYRIHIRKRHTQFSRARFQG